MGKDFRGLFENNRRRETNAVTGTLPYVVAPADLRGGTAEVVLGNEAHIMVTLPGKVIVTGVQVIIGANHTFAAGTAAVDVGGTNFIASADLTAEGLTASAATPALAENVADVVVTTSGLTVDPANENAVAKVVVTFIDYDRATMSYIGEE